MMGIEFFRIFKINLKIILIGIFKVVDKELIQILFYLYKELMNKIIFEILGIQGYNEYF